MSRKGGAGIEARWPPALAVLTLLLLLLLLGGRVRVFPAWVPFALAAAVISPMFAVQFSIAKPPWRSVEKWTMIIFFLVVGATTVENLAVLIRSIVTRTSPLSGIQLFSSSIAAWVTNVLIFSLLYWTIDCGGPEARVNAEGVRPDWLFPQLEAREVSPPEWCPTYVDYLFLAYCTATAFSPTDALPLTNRAKLLMMLESSISLATIVVVAARAINILGS